MNVQQKLEEFRGRLTAASAADEGYQLSKGSHTARERLLALFDEGTFVELGAFVTGRSPGADGKPSYEGVITGYGAVEGRLCYAYVQDPAVCAGAVGEFHAKKIAKTIEMAVKMGAPVVGVFDSKGVRLQESIDALCGYSTILEQCAAASGVIPQIAVITGPCAGGLALIAAQADLLVMSQGAEFFLQPPIVLKCAAGEEASEVGIAQSNQANGNVHLVCQDDISAMSQARALLGYLPSNSLGGSAKAYSVDLNGACPALEQEELPLRQVMEQIADSGTITELSEGFAGTMVTAFGRIGGEVVGFLANDGGICEQCAAKAGRFVSLCDSFGIPLVTLVNTDGFVLKAAEESAGSVRALARLATLRCAATCSKITLVTGKAYTSAFCLLTAGSDVLMAWPSAQIGALEPQAAAVLLCKEEIAASDDGKAAREACAQRYAQEDSAPYAAAAHGHVDQIIAPAETRTLLGAALMMLASKQPLTPPKKHANLPI